MDNELSSFLARHAPEITGDVVWGDRMRLRLSAFLGREMPPLAYLASVRAVVIHHGSVLVQRDRDSRHILPGGRLEVGELPEAALRREIGEETGWSLGRVEFIGFMHFRHLDPKAPDYRYPYPSFLQAVYAAEALRFSPGLKLDDGYEIGSDLVSISVVRQTTLTPKELMYLDAALMRLESAR